MKLKKMLCIILCAVMLLGMTACGGMPENPADWITEESQEAPDTPGSVPADEQETATDSSAALPEGSSFEIHFIDVGQADAALVLCDGHAMLIDGGNSEDSSLIYAYLKNHSIDHLDYIIATHGHEDHVGGLSGALNYATVGTAFCPVTSYDSNAFRNFVKYLNQQDTAITVPQHGDAFTLGSANCTIVGPISESDEPNNTSIVLRISYGATSFLFTGDAELEEETSILDAGYDIACTVLKVGHHGSSTSTGYRWLREASPAYAVISVGTDNSYGHPTENTLSRLRDADVKVYRTDMQGHIICTSDGNSVTFSTQRNADADTLTGAGASGNHTDNGSLEDTETSGSASYVLNTNTGIFHEPGCSSVAQISAKNRKDVTATREELIDQGYSPCGRCDP